MVATPDQWAALRTMVNADWDSHQGLIHKLTASRSLGDWGTLLAAAHYLAVRGQFPSGHSPADVIQLAAEVRARLDETGDQFDARPIELVARAALGDFDGVDDLDDEAVITAQTLTVSVLAEEGRLGDPEEFFREVEALAKSWGA